MRQLVKIEWYDAHSKDEWHDTPAGYIPLIVTSVGHIITGSDQHQLVLSDTAGGEALVPNIVDGEDLCFGTVHIPRGCIKSITELACVPDEQTDNA